MYAELTDIFVRYHVLSGNKFLTPNIIGEVTTAPRGKSFAGGERANIRIVELKVPSFAPDTAAQKQDFSRALPRPWYGPAKVTSATIKSG